MSLTLPAAYSNSSKLGNIQENWIVQLGYNDEGANEWIGIALSDTTVGGVFYHGAITNKPSVRTSINLANSTAKTGNISLSIVNFNYKGDDFSAELFLGTRKYINRNVKIYSQLNGETTLANCLQIYQGRLIDISHDDASVSLQITEQRPWDFISIPNTKSDTGIHIPVVYGDFTKNSHSTTTSLLSSKSLFPCPRLSHAVDDHFYYIYPKTYAGHAEPHYYDSNIDKFIPFTDALGVTAPILNADSIGMYVDMERGYFFIRPFSASGWTNSNDAVDTLLLSDATGATDTDIADFDETLTDTDTLNIEVPTVDGELVELYVYVKGSITHTDTSGNTSSALRVNSGTMISRTSSGTSSTSGHTINGVTGYSRITITDLDASSININLYTVASGTLSPNVLGRATATASVYDIFLRMKIQNDIVNEKTASYDIASKLKKVYSGADGLTESWSGSSAAIQYGHEAHRDMLIEYAGYTTTAPENWTALNNDRAIPTWKIRWWELDPVDLKKVLEQLQYEFGFIFKFRPDGTGSLIHIIQTSEMQTIANSASPYPVFNNADIWRY